MSVMPMQRVTICALKKNKKDILNILQRTGTIQINDIDSDDSAFQKADTSENVIALTKKIQVAEQALKIMQQYQPDEKSMFSSLQGRTIITVEEYQNKSEKSDEMYETAERTVELARKVAECQAAVINPQNQIEALEPWLALDVPLNSSQTKSTASFAGSLKGAWTLNEIYEKLAQLDEENSFDAVSVEIINSNKNQTCIFVTCSKSLAAKIEESLRTLGFTPPSVTYDVAPKHAVDELNASIKKYADDKLAYEEEIKGLAQQKESMRFLVDFLNMKKDECEVAKNLIQSKNTFYLEGYILKEKAPKLAKCLNSKFDIALDFVDSADEDTPVALKNNAFVSGTESVVESYSLPASNEPDPTPVISIFYYFFFGLMLGDFVYGLIMFLGCFIMLRKFKNMEPGTKKFLRMFMYCSISTMFWGAMFGSYMGDIVDVVSANWFGNKVTIPALWFVPLNEPMRMLVYSFAFGLIHMFVGLGMLGYKDIKNKQYLDFLYDVVFWYALLIGLILMLLNTSLFQSMAGMSFTFPPVLMTIAQWMSIVGAVGIILTSGRESRGFKRILKGLYGLYGVSGWLSDVLSYSRLLALGLATGVIASVINQMAAMLGTGVIGTILFIVVLIFGHAVNIGINALGAYVHTNRLQFVEFFGKFYDGGGKTFKPFAANTAYYKFKEDLE